MVFLCPVETIITGADLKSTLHALQEVETVTKVVIILEESCAIIVHAKPTDTVLADALYGWLLGFV